MLKRFFILCSGVDKDIVNSCSNGEQNKFAGIGATVFFTAIMAFIASSYALYTVFDNLYTSLVFGFLWGLLIFNLDRFIISTIKKRDSFKEEFIQALPRVILAIIIAIVISKPLEIKIFQKEIDTVLLKEKNKMTLANKKEVALYFKKDQDENKKELDSLGKTISNKDKEVAQLYQSYITEAEGSSGTKKIGKGPIYKEKRAAFDLASKQLDSIKNRYSKIITEKQIKANALQSNLNAKIRETQPIINHFDGLMARIHALDQLPWGPSFFIMLLFLAIETTPIFAKLLAPKGEFDFKLEEAERAIQTSLSHNRIQKELQDKTGFEIDEKILNELLTDKELYDYKKMNLLKLMKLKTDGIGVKHK